jgi:hypothetical protein
LRFPKGYCQCGCGAQTKIAPTTVRANGYRRGEPRPYMRGHSSKGPGPEYRIDEATGCWVWLRAKNAYGYGVLRPSRIQFQAHRVVYERHRGPIPEGLELDHLCRNTLCVNPAHLEPVTHAENIRRGKQTRLTQDAAAAIRASSASNRELARLYGVAPETVISVRRGDSWVAL